MMTGAENANLDSGIEMSDISSQVNRLRESMMAKSRQDTSEQYKRYNTNSKAEGDRASV